MRKGQSVTALLVVALPTFVYGVYRFSVGFVIPRIEEAYSISHPLMGGIVSLSVGVAGLGVLSTGYFVGKLGDRETVVVGLLLFSFPLIAAALSPNLVVFSLLFVLSAFGGGVMTTPTYGMVARLLPTRSGVGTGAITSAYNVGGLVGPLIVTYLLIGSTFWGVSLFFIALLAMAALAVFVLKFRGTTKSAIGGTSRHFRSVLRNRMVLVLAAADVLADLAFVTYLSWAPSFLLQTFSARGQLTVLLGLIFGGGIGLGGLGVLVAGTLCDRIGGRTTSVLGGSAAVLASLGLLLSRSLPVSIALILVGNFFLNWFWIVLTVLAQTNAKAAERAAAVSLVQTAGFFGAFVGPGVAGILGGTGSGALVATVTVPYFLYVCVMVFLYRDRSLTTQAS